MGGEQWPCYVSLHIQRDAQKAPTMQPVITILTELHPVELITFDRGQATGDFHSKLQKQHNVRPHDENKLELHEGPACTEGKIIHSCTKKNGFHGFD